MDIEQLCPLALFLNQQFLKMASISTFLMGNLPKDQELKKVIWPNIPIFGYLAACDKHARVGYP